MSHTDFDLNYFKTKSNEIKHKSLKYEKKYRKLLNKFNYLLYNSTKYYKTLWSFTINVYCIEYLSYNESVSTEGFTNINPIDNSIEDIVDIHSYFKLSRKMSAKCDHETDSPASNDSGIQTDENRLNSDYFINNNNEDNTSELKEVDNFDQNDLPLGWIKCCDDDGIYYWHKPTGTVTRSPPSAAYLKRASNYDINRKINEDIKTLKISQSLNLNENFIEEKNELLCSNDDFINSQISDVKVEIKKQDDHKLTKRFYVRSLGWVKIAESELTLDKSSKAVNKCIHDLSHGLNDYNDVVARWGEGKDLYLDIEDNDLILVDPIEEKILNRQPINMIRVWGVGRDNGRDFAYVAKDKLTKIHMCHVFRCEDVPAKEIANVLRDICKKTSLLTDTNKSTTETTTKTSQLFPPTVDEPKKTLNCKYLGSLNVTKSCGMDVLNEAIFKIYNKIIEDNPKDNDSNEEDLVEDLSEDGKTIKDKLPDIEVTVSPSTINAEIINDNLENQPLFECRVRYLTFLGISATNVKLCGIIINCADNTFVCHAFYCEPSAGPLCKTIEAACKLRYQKCLDAHPDLAQYSEAKRTNTSTLGTQLRNVFDLIRMRRKS